jgi:hypothetical protein
VWAPAILWDSLLFSFLLERNGWFSGFQCIMFLFTLWLFLALTRIFILRFLNGIFFLWRAANWPTFFESLIPLSSPQSLNLCMTKQLIIVVCSLSRSQWLYLIRFFRPSRLCTVPDARVALCDWSLSGLSRAVRQRTNQVPASYYVTVFIPYVVSYL